MKKNLLSFALIVGILALIVFSFLRSTPKSPLADSPPTAGSRSQSSPDSKPQTQNSKLSTPSAEVSHLADDLNSPSGDIRADLRILQEIVGTFRSNFPQTGNPVGDNREITAALTGKNRLQLALIPSQHVAINAAGELVDRWGSPLFFHAEASNRMEIRSAGPDKTMWNADDVVTAP